MSDDGRAEATGVWSLQSLIGEGAGPPPDPPPRQAEPAPWPAQPPPAAELAPAELPSWPAEPAELAPPRAGPAAHRPDRVRVLLIAGVLAAVLIGAVAGLTRFTGGDEQEAADPAGVNRPAAPVAGSTPTRTYTTAPSASADPDTAALDRMNALRRQDAAQLVLDGRYAAQLSSKVVGIVDPYQVAANGTNTFRAPDILAEHLDARSSTQDAAVLLALSTDVGNQSRYNGEPLWITLAMVGLPTADAVTAWCRGHFPNLAGEALRNRCLPKKLDPPRG